MVNDEDYYSQIVCPISVDVMTDPVITPSGITYDRKNIEDYIDKFGKDPVSKTKLTKKQLKPDTKVKALLKKMEKENKIQVKEDKKDENMPRLPSKKGK